MTDRIERCLWILKLIQQFVAALNFISLNKHRPMWIKLCLKRPLCINEYEGHPRMHQKHIKHRGNLFGVVRVCNHIILFMLGIISIHTQLNGKAEIIARVLCCSHWCLCTMGKHIIFYGLHQGSVVESNKRRLLDGNKLIKNIPICTLYFLPFSLGENFFGLRERNSVYIKIRGRSSHGGLQD